MELTNLLPITNEMLTDPSIYYLMCGFRGCLASFSVEMQPDQPKLVHLTYNPITKETIYRLCGDMDSKTYKAHFTDMPATIITDNYVVLMPVEVWDTLLKELLTIPLSRRKVVARVFLYIYYWAMQYGGSYGHARQLIIQELRINGGQFSDAAEWLETKGLIVRGDYDVRDKTRRARTYLIPQKLWNYQCAQTMKKILAKTK